MFVSSLALEIKNMKKQVKAEARIKWWKSKKEECCKEFRMELMEEVSISEDQVEQFGDKVVEVRLKWFGHTG